MKILKVDVQSGELGKPEQFTGSVWNEIVAIGEPPSNLHVAKVTFGPASRTAWHIHPLGQILLVVSGVGRVQKAGEPVIALHPGDSVSIAPGERHWHGAAPDRMFVHLAMQGATVDGQQAIWLEPVTDEEYLKMPD
jgi:quercetin dioxygenase-like cupin family protein